MTRRPDQRTIRTALALAGIVSGIVSGTALLGGATLACSTVITWQADLAAVPATPKTPAMASAPTPDSGPALGKATVEFDFDHPGATFKVETQVPGDVQQITLHVARTFSDATGPVLFTLYTASDGPLPPVYTKRVGEADLQKQPSLKILTLADAVHAVLDGRAYVTVTPKASSQTPAQVASRAPQPAELVGFITMHKEEIYSDQPGDTLHDSALHQAASSLASPSKK